MTTDAGPNMLLPRRFEDVTAGWLTGQLAARYPGIEVLGFEVVEVKSSHTTKVRIRWDLNDAGRAAGLPEHVCLKANWSGMSTGQITEREARFYHLIRDRLTFPVPQSYFAMWDTDGSGNGLAIMEDLALSPGRFGTSTDRMGVDAVAVGLETLAVIHGAMWGSPALNEADWLPRSMGTDNDSEQVIQYWNYIQYNLENPAYQAVVPTWVLERPALMHHALDELSAFELALAGPRCLVHGDAHQGNSFLRNDGQRVWHDWQLVRSGSPWRDVNYFLITALTIEQRRGADRDLVEHYRLRLIATGAHGVPGRDEAWQQFMRWPAYGTQAWLGNINVWGQSDGAEMVARFFAASDDYDTINVLTAGKPPRREFIPGQGAYRLPRSLRST